ncbi:MAG: NADPH-dependent ferric siderophore reductase [Microbacterium sp. SCN 70-18]|uniref:siderophore-interacting protein n=1 Tax=Microbacterium aurantiacum TaxID=162393 RepID=UPI0008691B47|nr:siderophore-interacting protein [Microbacterium aurantiacum]MBN9200391.1 siderophore-interacting protein [Microbacterium chocolatum]ODT09310.1 MAG: NADPH-dependent ferric siderophore reductase [Microbacterium sp. SCN 70-18]
MPTTLVVTATSWTTPVVRRVHFRSDDLSAFAGSRFTDRYVKLVFPRPGVVLPEGVDVRAMRGVVPPEDMPIVRTYTALYPDAEAGTLAIDFVVHGDEGIAGPWAARAEPGDTLVVNGPGGAYAPSPEADWHLLVGDESALPAITAALEALPGDAVARVILQLEQPGHEPELPLPDDAEVVHLYRSEPATDADPLLAAVKALEWPEGRVHAFVHGEAAEVMHGIRPYLYGERGLTRGQVSISGYWRRGRTEEGFREWKQQLAAAEAPTA